MVAVDCGHPEEVEGGRMGGQDESQSIVMAWMGTATTEGEGIESESGMLLGSSSM